MIPPLKDDLSLRESEAMFQTLLESASVAIVIVDESGTIVLVNARAEEMFGYQREELIGEKLELLLPERIRQLHTHHRASYVAEPRMRPMGVGLELAGRRKDGTEFPLEIGLSAVRTQQGLLTMSFVTDITERQRAQKALHMYAQRLESMRETDRAILSARSSREIAQVALGYLSRLVPCISASVVLFDYATSAAFTLSSVGPEMDEALPHHSLDSFDHLMQPGGDLHHLSQQDGHIHLDVPLIAQGERIGALRLMTSVQRPLDPNQIEIAREVANQLAVALQQAQLREDLERHAAELEGRVRQRTQEVERRREVAEGLRDILTRLNIDRPLVEILDYVVVLAGRLLGTDATALYHNEGGGGALRVVAARGLSTEHVADARVPIGKLAVGQAMERRAPVAIEDVLALDESLHESFTLPEQQQFLDYLAERWRARLAVPLIVKEELFGGIVLYYREPRPFNEEEIALVVAFADQVALAIENAWLREQVQESAVAAERNRLARDLHDAVTQTLFSASLIAEVLPQLWEKKPDEAMRRAEELRQLTRGALAEMRTLLFELRPTALIRTELTELIRQLGEAIMGRARLPVQVQAEGTCQLPAEVQLAFYRIAQEALNNVVKHAGATRVTVKLDCTDGAVRLMIEDDGQGFDPGGVTSERLGLEIMRERADAIGATLTIRSSPTNGAMISATWNTLEERNDG